MEIFQYFTPFVLTIKGVQRFAVSYDRQGVVVVKLVIKLMWVRVWVSRLWRPRAAVRCVMLLTGVICVTALRTEGKQATEICVCMICSFSLSMDQLFAISNCCRS